MNKWMVCPWGKSIYKRKYFKFLPLQKENQRTFVVGVGWVFVLGAGWHVSAWGLVCLFLSFIHSSHVCDEHWGMNGPCLHVGYSFGGGNRENSNVLWGWNEHSLISWGNRSQRQDRECCELCLWGMDCPWSVKWRKRWGSSRWSTPAVHSVDGAALSVL